MCSALRTVDNTEASDDEEEEEEERETERWQLRDARSDRCEGVIRFIISSSSWVHVPPAAIPGVG